jgi:hypothetical protein
MPTLNGIEAIARLGANGPIPCRHYRAEARNDRTVGLVKTAVSPSASTIQIKLSRNDLRVHATRPRQVISSNGLPSSGANWTCRAFLVNVVGPKVKAGRSIACNPPRWLAEAAAERREPKSNEE